MQFGTDPAKTHTHAYPHYHEMSGIAYCSKVKNMQKSWQDWHLRQEQKQVNTEKQLNHSHT